MKNKVPSLLVQTAAAGALAGFLLLLGVRTLMAQTVVTVNDFHRNSKSYVGSNVQISGIAYSIRQEIKQRNGQGVAYTTFNLYENGAKGKKGKYYVFVSIPASSFKTPITEGDPATITGPIQWPYQVGRIDDN